MKKLIWIIIIVLAVLGLTFLVQPQQSVIAPTNTSDTNSEPAPDSEDVIIETDYVRYLGRDGATAFELLHELTDIGFQDYDFGVFVESIHGIKPEEGYFWKLFINGEPAQVGATDLQTHNGDVVEWKIEEINESS